MNSGPPWQPLPRPSLSSRQWLLILLILCVLLPVPFSATPILPFQAGVREESDLTPFRAGVIKESDFTQRIRVIVQKQTVLDTPETAVAQAGGKLIRDLAFINAFVAEVPYSRTKWKCQQNLVNQGLSRKT